MDAANKTTTPVPLPYLGRLFEPGTNPVIATGFNYRRAEIDVHGVESHGAIDFDLPRGTKILAPADGYYLATYGEVLTRNEDGSPRRMSLQQALKTNPANQGIKPPGDSGEWELHYGSYVIQGWHERGRYTQYAHVDWIAPEIPFYSPVEVKDDKGRLTGDLHFSPLLRAPVAQYRRPGVAAFVRAGQVIAEVGMTGCGWGRRNYDFAKMVHGRPDFRSVDYPYYTQPHLHFATFGRRAPRTRRPKLMDPFGLYGDIEAGYPERLDQWPIAQPGARHHPLWLPQT